MVIPSIHNLLARLDSTFKKDSQDTNFYQLLQMVAFEIDNIRREGQSTKLDNYFYHVRDDQLFSNLGVLLHINKQPFFTKRKTTQIPLKIVISEDFASQSKCLTERLAKIEIEWQTELSSTSVVEYTDTSPYIIPASTDPQARLFGQINQKQLLKTTGNSGKTHSVTILAQKFSSDLYFRVQFVNQVGELRQSEFVHLKLPDYPLIAPVFTTAEPNEQDAIGETIRTPLEDDPYGLVQYRKILYGVLSSYLTGPTIKGVTFGLQPFFDLPVEIVENFPAMPDLEDTNVIQPEDEIFVHTFQVNVIIDNINNARNLGELNEQVQQVLEFIKPAHTLPKLSYVIPDHFFCPSDNPFGTKGSIALEPTIGPCGEKVYINPISLDLGANGYYQDVLGYRLYCSYAIDYFATVCPPIHFSYHGSSIPGSIKPGEPSYYSYGSYGEEIIQPINNHGYSTSLGGYRSQSYNINRHLQGYFDVLDRNYFYIQNGERLILCPFVKTREVELALEHRNSSEPLGVRIEGDVDEGPNTFKQIPFSKSIRVTLKQGNGPKTVSIVFIYPEQIKTNTKTRRLNETTLAPGCHGEISVDAVTYLLNTLPEECCAEAYIVDETVADIEALVVEEDVLQHSFSFKMNESVLNGPHILVPSQMDEIKKGPNPENSLVLNATSRTLNDPDIVLLGEYADVPEIDLESFVCDSTRHDTLILNSHGRGDCNDNSSVLNRSKLIVAENEFFLNDGYVTAEIYESDKAFILNQSVMNNIEGPVISPIVKLDIEPWNPHLKDRYPCQKIQNCIYESI